MKRLIVFVALICAFIGHATGQAFVGGGYSARGLGFEPGLIVNGGVSQRSGRLGFQSEAFWFFADKVETGDGNSQVWTSDARIYAGSFFFGPGFRVSRTTTGSYSKTGYSPRAAIGYEFRQNATRIVPVVAWSFPDSTDNLSRGASVGVEFHSGRLRVVPQYSVVRFRQAGGHLNQSQFRVTSAWVF